MIGLTHYLALSGIIFSIGLYGALTKRNAIAILMAVELMFNAVNVAVVSMARYTVPVGIADGDFGVLLTGQVFAIFVITVAAAEVALGLAIVLAIFRNRQTVDVSQMDLMKR